MEKRKHPQRLAIWVFLIMLALVSATLAQTGQISRVISPGVKARMDIMNDANRALTNLSDMMGARALFDKSKAQIARKSLIATTRKIPHAFRKPHMDNLSNARPAIWQNWDDFRDRARAAHRVARAVRTTSLPVLRQTLPRMIQACLNCHEIYRNPMR